MLAEVGQACHPAAELGIANSTLSSVKVGKRRFTRDHLRRLSEYFGVPTGTFAE